jgi:hypothetical protein
VLACGGGQDVAYVDRFDAVDRDCETVHRQSRRGAALEGAPVRAARYRDAIVWLTGEYDQSAHQRYFAGTVPARTGCLSGGGSNLGVIRATVSQQYTERNGTKRLAVEFRPRLFGAYGSQDTSVDATASHWGAVPGDLFNQVMRYDSLPTTAANPWWVRSWRYTMTIVDQVYRIEARLSTYKRTAHIWRRVHRTDWLAIATCTTGSG